MENKVIDNKTRRYCLYIGLLACLVAITAMAGHAAAAGWYLADRDGTQAGDLDGTNGVIQISSITNQTLAGCITTNNLPPRNGLR